MSLARALAVAVIGACWSVCNLSAAERLNVLFIASDDLSARLGCYGDAQAKTPNIDRLAARGVRFDRAYCQTPLCNPSRASFLTGLRPDTVRTYENDTHFREAVPDVVTLPQTFQRGGYVTARVGKLYHYNVPASIGTDGFDDLPSWNKTLNPRGRDRADEESIFTLTPEAKGTLRFGGTLSWLAAEGSDTEQTDGLIADAAVDLLRDLKDKPFFLGVGFFRPHTPYVAPKSWFELYPLGSLKSPRAPQGWLATIPSASRDHRKPQEDSLSEEHRQRAIQAYYASISFMDAQVGKVLDGLERQGLTDKTVVVFLSDHGYQLGEHELWQKRSLYEWSLRVPLIVSVPGNAANGSVAKSPVELVDLHATLAELCGLPQPRTEGTSLAAQVRHPAQPTNRPAFSQIARTDNAIPRERKIEQVTYHGHTIRTDRYRYIEWDGGTKGAELYDEFADPEEIKNLVADPAQAATVAVLKSQLDAKFPRRRPHELPHPRGFTRLFDGRSVDGWIARGGTATYRVENGQLIGKTAEGSKNTFLCPPRDYADFELEFDVLCDPELNSGVQIRSHEYAEDTPQPSMPKRTRAKGEVYGYQCEICPRGKKDAGNFWDEGRWTKWWAEASPAAKDAYRDGEWNRYRIVAQGDRIRSWINSVPVADFRDSLDATGFLGFQVHGIKAGTGPYEVRWRDIRIRELKPGETVP